MKQNGQAFNEESIGTQPLPPGDSKVRRNVKGNDVGARVTAASNSAWEEEEGGMHLVQNQSPLVTGKPRLSANGINTHKWHTAGSRSHQYTVSCHHCSQRLHNFSISFLKLQLLLQLLLLSFCFPLRILFKIIVLKNISDWNRSLYEHTYYIPYGVGRVIIFIFYYLMGEHQTTLACHIHN